VLPGDYRVALKVAVKNIRSRCRCLQIPVSRRGKRPWRHNGLYRKNIASLEEGVTTHRTITRILDENRITLAAGVGDSLSALISGRGINLRSGVCCSCRSGDGLPEC